MCKIGIETLPPHSALVIPHLSTEGKSSSESRSSSVGVAGPAAAAAAAAATDAVFVLRAAAAGFLAALPLRGLLVGENATPRTSFSVVLRLLLRRLSFVAALAAVSPSSFWLDVLRLPFRRLPSVPALTAAPRSSFSLDVLRLLLRPALPFVAVSVVAVLAAISSAAAPAALRLLLRRLAAEALSAGLAGSASPFPLELRLRLLRRLPFFSIWPFSSFSIVSCFGSSSFSLPSLIELRLLVLRLLLVCTWLLSASPGGVLPLLLLLGLRLLLLLLRSWWLSLVAATLRLASVSPLRALSPLTRRLFGGFFAEEKWEMSQRNLVYSPTLHHAPRARCVRCPPPAASAGGAWQPA